ncbi:hypothetical protein [Chryseobacterium tongliaoense]|uniref:hypothetical protein n=1 Tax=Chryseobacterium tongliaoense TaxID=3240933 RepID=UPI003516A431
MLQNVGMHMTSTELTADHNRHQMILTNSLILQSLDRYSKRIFSILLLFLFFNLFSQKIAIDNKNDYALTIKYKDQKIKLKGGESKTISGNEIRYLNIMYDNGKNISKDVPLFLKPDESLKMTIGNYDQDHFIKFKGDRDSLHSLVVNQQHWILYINEAKYIDIYYKKKNTQGLINFSTIVLADYLNKIKKSLNASPLDKEDEIYKRIGKYAINDWLSSVYLIFSGSKTLDLRTREVVLYYYNKYLKRDIEDYSCEYKIQYNTIEVLAQHINQINIALPKYPIIENTGDDAVNQYIPQSCQKYYFINKLKYSNHINSPEKEYYEKVLKEKFNN